MRTPTELELQHIAAIYDPLKAHKYYEEHKKLKGRKPGQTENQRQQRSALSKAAPGWRDPRTGKSMDQIRKEARAKARTRVTEQINRLEGKLKKIEARIRELEHKEASEDRKGKAKKERAAKEKDKPKTAAEKAKASRESEKYRKEHKQELANKAKDDSNKSGGGKSSGKKKSGAKVADLKALSTRVKGQIAVAKQKLAAL
jgi:chromosome segregation ATPase